MEFDGGPNLIFIHEQQKIIIMLGVPIKNDRLIESMYRMQEEIGTTYTFNGHRMRIAHNDRSADLNHLLEVRVYQDERPKYRNRYGVFGTHFYGAVSPIQMRGVDTIRDLERCRKKCLILRAKAIQGNNQEVGQRMNRNMNYLFERRRKIMGTILEPKSSNVIRRAVETNDCFYEIDLGEMSDQQAKDVLMSVNELRGLRVRLVYKEKIWRCIEVNEEEKKGNAVSGHSPVSPLLAIDKFIDALIRSGGYNV